MSEFINRVGSNLNKREFQVTEIVRDNLGEIVTIKANMLRSDDSVITTEGTELNKESLTSIIESMIDGAINELRSVPTSVVDLDKNNLILADSITEGCTLPSVGVNGSNITWIVVSPSTVSISDNVVSLLGGESVEATLRATISKNGCSETKDFTVTVEKDEDIIDIDRNNLVIPLVLTSNVTLPTSGINGSSISWSVVGQGLVLQNNTLVVTRTTSNQSATVQATLTKDTQTRLKTFNVIVLSLYNITEEKHGFYLNNNDYNYINFTITSTDNNYFYIHITDYDENYLIVTYDTTYKTSHVFNVCESLALRELTTKPNVLSFKIKIYLKDTSVCVDEITKNITYTLGE